MNITSIKMKYSNGICMLLVFNIYITEIFLFIDSDKLSKCYYPVLVEDTNILCVYSKT